MTALLEYFNTLLESFDCFVFFGAVQKGPAMLQKHHAVKPNLYIDMIIILHQAFSVDRSIPTFRSCPAPIFLEFYSSNN